MTDELDTYERDDRDPLSAAIKGLEDLVASGEVLQLAEKYGLSVNFDPERIDWTCTDPKDRYRGRANTPCGAIYYWDCKRQEVEGDDEWPKLSLVKAAQRQPCSGVSTSWCPNCGDCSCPRNEDGGFPEGQDDPNCPLHAPDSPHADGPTR